MFTKDLENWAKELPHGAAVLDVGCGTGKTINWLVSERPDLSIVALDVLDMRSKIDDRIVFHQIGVEEISEKFETDQFDAVICQHVIEHLAQPFDLMAGVKNILKQGGTIFIETPNWTRLFIPFHQDFFWNDYSHVHPYSKTSLQRLFNDFDFSLSLVKSLSSVPLWSLRGLRASERKSFLLLPYQLIKKLPNAALFDVLICIAKKK